MHGVRVVLGRDYNCFNRVNALFLQISSFLLLSIEGTNSIALSKKIFTKIKQEIGSFNMSSLILLFEIGKTLHFNKLGSHWRRGEGLYFPYFTMI